MAKTKDKYDEAVEYLTANPHEIGIAWGNPSSALGGELFRFASPGLAPPMSSRGEPCGCLTQIRGDERYVALRRGGRVDRLLTAEIRADRSIPSDRTKIEPRHLKRFAYWQRRLDKELRRS